jgi:hypothetical protein
MLMESARQVRGRSGIEAARRLASQHVSSEHS